MATILNEFGKPLERDTAPVRPIRARYDAAQTTPANAGHWAGADGFSARLANSPGVRKVLRERARYEWANNCYCKGMIGTDADYVVGTGPRLQLLTGDERYNREVEHKYHQWARLVKLGRKYWTMRAGWRRDGESFAEFVNNYRLACPVKLDLHLVECDQITDHFGHYYLDIRRDDGLVLDDYGNVMAYKKWPHHPGDIFGWGIAERNGAETIRARDMIHLFRLERAGQYRGVPEITPALMLYPAMRRWTYAALGAAEKAARIAGVIKSTATAIDPAEVVPLEDIYLEADSFLTMPQGWDISQVRSEHPGGNYEMFKSELIGEMARCLNMPFNIAAANSSRYNFASGKLDYLPWNKFVGIDQNHFDDEACTPTFSRWFFEARRIEGYLPPAPAREDGEVAFDDRREVPPHVWFWDGQDIIDPREAMAKATGLQYGTETYPRAWAKKGLDWEQEMTAQAKALGMTLPEYQGALRLKLFGPPPGLVDPGEEEDGEEEGKSGREDKQEAPRGKTEAA